MITYSAGRHCARLHGAPTPRTCRYQHFHGHSRTQHLALNLQNFKSKLKRNSCNLQHFSGQVSSCLEARQVWGAPHHIFGCTAIGYDHSSNDKNDADTFAVTEKASVQLSTNLRCGKSSLSLPMILAGKRHALIASRKNAVEVPTLPLKIVKGMTAVGPYIPTWA